MNVRMGVIGSLLLALSILLLEPGENRRGGGARAGDLVEVEILASGAKDDAEIMTVSTAGTVDVPLVGDMQVEGQTADEIREKLAAKLSREYYVNPRVQVRIVSCSTP